MVKNPNATLLNVRYVRPNPDKNIKECFRVVYSTPDGNVHYKDEPANATIWFTKPECRDYDYNKPWEKMSNMYSKTVKISKIRDEITSESGDYGKRIMDIAYKSGDFQYRNQVFKWPYSYGADFQPEYYYIHDWFQTHDFKMPKLTKAYMDIECDGIDHTIDMNHLDSSAYAPVNAVTIINDETNECVLFVLRPYHPQGVFNKKEYDRRMALYEEQRKAHEYIFSHLDEFEKSLHELYDEKYGQLNYKIREYELEIELIADVFRFLNTRKPNFCLIWNMRFDIQYLYYRIKVLGYDPASIMCHYDFPNPSCMFIQDNSTFEIEKQFDQFICSSYTNYLCQMRNYGSIRKSQHKLQSLRLDYIAERELKSHKVDYSDVGNLNLFMYKRWRDFLIYNVNDVMLQRGIEHRTNDVVTYYTRAMKNWTPYNKIFRETHLLRNVREQYFEKQGLVQGNNINTIHDLKTKNADAFYGSEESDDDIEITQGDKKISYKGAINAEPSMNMDVGYPILGRKTNNYHKNCADFDMGAFYPSIKIASNMDPATLLYKAAFINEEFISGQFHNRSLNQQYFEKDKNGQMREVDITGEAVNTYASQNFMTFAYNYLNIPDITSLEMMVANNIEESIHNIA